MNDETPRRLFPMAFDVAAQAADVARRAGANALCPACVATNTEIRLSLLRYVVDLLNEVGQAYDNEFIDAADLRKALTAIAEEIEAELLRD